MTQNPSNGHPLLEKNAASLEPNRLAKLPADARYFDCIDLNIWRSEELEKPGQMFNIDRYLPCSGRLQRGDIVVAPRHGQRPHPRSPGGFQVHGGIPDENAFRRVCSPEVRNLDRGVGMGFPRSIRTLA